MGVGGYLPWVRTAEDGKMPEQAVAGFGRGGGGMGVEGGDVGDVLDVAPGVVVGAVESTVIQVFTHQLARRLVAEVIHLASAQK